MGCGTSPLSEQLYQIAGYENLTNVDFSQTLIDELSERMTQFEEMEYMCLDICNIKKAVEENSID